MKTHFKTLIGVASLLTLTTLAWLGLGAPGMSQALCTTGSSILAINANGSIINTAIPCGPLNFTLTNAQIAGPSASPYPSASPGDLTIGRNNTTAKLWFGGGATPASADFGITFATTFSVNGQIAGQNSSTATVSYVPEVYASGGAAVASTLHAVLGTCAYSASVTCTPAVFSGQAVFASATSYSCSASAGAGTFAQVGALAVATQSTTGIIITAATSNSQTVTYLCIGT